jgi:gliding motility-associated-like protein
MKMLQRFTTNDAMKRTKTILLCILLTVLIWTPTRATNSYCQNLGFELGNFTNWVGYTWRYSTESPAINTNKVQGIVSRRQTIISDVTAYDSNTGNALKMIPPGYLYSARLGDAITSADSNPRGWEQSLRYTTTIDSTNALLIMKFALVLEYASDHTAKMEPRFRLTLFDKNGDTIPDCANYDVYSSNNNVSGFKTYTPTSTSSSPGAQTSPVKWRNWTTVGANLLKYVGQSVTIVFMSADCTGRYHYGYAYFVAGCQPMNITVKYCSGDSIATLTAPQGFESYSWTNSSGTVIDTSQILYLTDPAEGATYYCKMVSATGCTANLQSTIAKYVPKAAFSSYMLDCKSNTVQLVNQSTSTHGTMSYKWNLENGYTSTEKNPKYTFITSGMHEVTLDVSNPPSSCADTLTKLVESFSPPLVGMSGDSTYCPGLSIFLKAYGAYEYVWNNGSNADSIEVSAPGGKFWLLGRSSTGCTSDTIYKTVSAEPDWIFSVEGDTILCKGGSTSFTASGATTYYWNTGDTTNTITMTTPGMCISIGLNKRGCKKAKTFEVVEYPLPNVNFTLSAAILNCKHSQLTCYSLAISNVHYCWNMGDSTTETGSTVQHTYIIPKETLSYIIKLIAKDQYSCVDSSTQTIDVAPFVPNVFSPNGDGINDVFMSNVDLQVFDRNGLLLYKGTDGWDGRHSGRHLDPDTYFYLIRYTDRNQKTRTQKGYVTLVNGQNSLK